jgi:hypothetical protein
MANEFTITSSLKLTNGNDSFSRSANFNADQAAVGGPTPGVTSISTSHEALTTNDLTSKGWAVLKNLDDTNFIEIGLDVSATFYPLIKLLPGEQVQVRLSPAVTVYARSDTAAVRLDAQIFEA